MDDMYQYAASAVNSNKEQSSSNQVQEEDDVILKAFNNMGWGRKWSSLVDTVKKQVCKIKFLLLGGPCLILSFLI
jgi:hypothetical protein